MKRVKFNDYHRQWDRFFEFHVHTHDGYVQFENSVIINTHYRFDPDTRNKKTLHETYITMPDDRKFDFFIDGEKIPTAWLTQDGNPYLQVDPQFEYNNVTRLGGKDSPVMPSNMRWAKAISVNYDERMRGGMIKVSKPYKANKEELEWMAEVKTQASLLEELDPYEVPRWNRLYAVTFDPLAPKRLSPQEYMNNLHNNGESGKNAIACIAKRGWTSTRITENFETLTAKPRTSTNL
jgi:hypothetical protein